MVKHIIYVYICMWVYAHIYTCMHIPTYIYRYIYIKGNQLLSTLVTDELDPLSIA